MIRSSQPPQLDLARNKFDLPLLVDMEAFFEFSFWLAEELLDLEAKYGSKHSSRHAEAWGKGSNCLSRSCVRAIQSRRDIAREATVAFRGCASLALRF